MTPSILEEYRRVCDRLSEAYPATDYRKVLYSLVAQATFVSEPVDALPVNDGPRRRQVHVVRQASGRTRRFGRSALASCGRVERGAGFHTPGFPRPSPGGLNPLRPSQIT